MVSRLTNTRMFHFFPVVETQTPGVHVMLTSIKVCPARLCGCFHFVDTAGRCGRPGRGRQPRDPRDPLPRPGPGHPHRVGGRTEGRRGDRCPRSPRTGGPHQPLCRGGRGPGSPGRPLPLAGPRPGAPRGSARLDTAIAKSTTKCRSTRRGRMSLPSGPPISTRWRTSRFPWPRPTWPAAFSMPPPWRRSPSSPSSSGRRRPRNC